MKSGMRRDVRPDTDTLERISELYGWPQTFVGNVATTMSEHVVQLV
jgi:hypothetical protein